MMKRVFALGVLMLAVAASIGCGTTPPTVESTPPPSGPDLGSPAPTCAGNTYTFENDNSYPVWLAEGYQGGGDLGTNTIAPAKGDWMLAAGDSVSLCMPSGWSGRFWPRTECDFAGSYANDKGYKACSATSDCASGHVCYGGTCMLDCSGKTKDTPFCQGKSGLNNTNAICVKSGFAADVSFCSFPQGTVCKTGDCQGLYQCYGEWDKNKSEYGATGPVSLFEPTSNSAKNVNYDVSLVSGYNTQITIKPSSPSCPAPGCVSDLNASCPANLQVTEAPTAAKSAIPCGKGTYCQTGSCQNNSTCVIACNDPSDQCGRTKPPAGLKCTTVVPEGDGSTFADMYFVKNQSGTIDPSGKNQTMISGNQGNATCWGDADCLPGESCDMSMITNFPAGVGVCKPSSGSLQPQPNCATSADKGNVCGGYETQGFTTDIGYTCVSTGKEKTDVACVPAYDPAVKGLGTLVSNAKGTEKFYSGTGSPLNPEFVTAAKQAGDGKTPWYETFSAACPHTYGWQYDDHAGGFSCAVKTTLNLTVIFGPAPAKSGSLTLGFPLAPATDAPQKPISEEGKDNNSPSDQNQNK